MPGLTLTKSLGHLTGKIGSVGRAPATRSSSVHVPCSTINPTVPLEYSILSVERNFRLTPWEHVAKIICRDPDGVTNRMAYADAIRRLKEGTARFCVIHEGQRIPLELARDSMGNDCLRAIIGGQSIDALLALPDYRDETD